MTKKIPFISIDGNYADAFNFAVMLDDYDVGFNAGGRAAVPGKIVRPSYTETKKTKPISRRIKKRT